MKPLRMIVCMKPVPDPRQWDRLELDIETMLLKREELSAVINPLDRNAIETAIRLKQKTGGTVTVITMAPREAEEQLREALALGCDDAVLLTDKAFAGADTLATARCLRAAIKKGGAFDVVFCGGYSLDGSTAQVGPQLAELLMIPDLGHVTSLKLSARGRITASCATGRGVLVCESRLPLLITCSKEINTPPMATMRGIRSALEKTVTVWSARDIGLNSKSTGLAGSPTRMLNVQPVTMGRKGEFLRGSPFEMATTLIKRLQTDKVLSRDGGAS